MPEISIIIPVYNVERYLHRCIDSILAQTCSNFELILVDDGSRDDSSTICDEYAEKDARIRVIHQKNAGVSAARNTGLSLARGRYISFCDSDDYVNNTWLEKMYSLMMQHDSDMVICGYSMVSKCGDGKIREVRYSDTDISSVESEAEIQCFWRRFLRNQNMLVLSVWNKMFRTDVIRRENLRFDDTLSHSEDALFVFKYMQVSNHRAIISNKPLYNYVIDMQGSLTKKYKTDYWYVKQHALAELKRLFEICGICIEENDRDMATYIITVITVSINNVLSLSYRIDFRERYQKGQEILKSKDCRTAFAYGDFVEIHPVYKAVLRTRCFYLIWIFHRIAALKSAL